MGVSHWSDGFFGIGLVLWQCIGNDGGFYGVTIWPSDAYKKNQNAYRSPEGAVKALVEALGANDEKKLLVILGPEGKKLIFG